MEVSSHAAADHAITGAHLVAVFQQDVYHSGRDPDLAEGVMHCNGWAGWHTGVQEICTVCLPVTWASIYSQIWRDDGSVLWILAGMGGPNLASVQELSKQWGLGIDGCSLEHQKGKLWVGTTVLSTLECMLHGFYTCLSESI